MEKNDFLNMIEEAETIAITGHVRPDGDCVGSTIGLYNYIISNYDKEVQVYLEEFSKDFLFFCMMPIKSVIRYPVRCTICVLQLIAVMQKDREVFFRYLNMQNIRCVSTITFPIRDLAKCFC